MNIQKHTNRIPLTIGLAVAVPVALRLLALAGIGERIWGFDMLRYMDVPTALVFSLLPFAAFLLYRRQFALQLEAMMKWAVLPVSFAAGLVAITLFFPMHTFFYGDGGLLIPQVFRFAGGDTVDASLLLNLKSSPLAGVLITLATEQVPRLLALLHLPLPSDALYPFTVVSLISLVSAVTYTLLAWRGRAAVLRLLVLCGGAGWLLYFGYVEYYAPFYAAVYVFLLSGERVLRGDGRLWPVLLSYVVALLSHYQALALLPALGVLLMLRQRKKTGGALHPGLLAAGAAGILLLAVAVYFVLGMQDSASRIVMPMIAQEGPAGTQAYTLLSSFHLLDLLNLLLLLAPAGVAFLVLSSVQRLPGIALGREGVFHLAAVFFFGLFCVFANTSLGLARDWDICAPLGVMILLAAVSIFDAGSEESETHSMVIAAASFLLTLPWIAVNVDSGTSAQRFERVLELDADHMYVDYSLSGYEALRKFHASIGDHEKNIELTKKKILIVDYPENYTEFIARTLETGSADLRVPRMRWLLRTLTERISMLRQLPGQRSYALSLAQADSVAEAACFQLIVAGIGAPLRPQIDDLLAASGRTEDYPAVLALDAYSGKRYDEATVMLISLVDRGFLHPTVFRLLATSLSLQQRFREALAAFEAGLAVFPDDALTAFLLGKYYTQAGIQLDRARALLQSCADRGLPADRQDEIRTLLQRLP